MPFPETLMPGRGAEATTASRLTAWPAERLAGDIRVPGDKSLSHRALILGGLADGETRVAGLLESADVLATAEAVRAFGGRVERLGDGTWRIVGSRWRSPPRPIDCGNSGTAARLLMGAASAFPISALFTGDRSLSARPMARVLDPLRRMGAAAAGDRLPVRIAGGALCGIRLTNDPASAQVKSAVLLAGLGADGPVEVIERARSRDHTETMLQAFGCDVIRTPDTVALGPNRRLRGCALSIAGDPSSAAFPIVAALTVPGSDVTVRSVLSNPLRTGLLDTLREMGAALDMSGHGRSGLEPVADITARFSRLTATYVPASRAPSMIDEYPILAVAAASAGGVTVMHGLAELRVKESDRLAALVAGLDACGVRAWLEGDSLHVMGCGGAPPGGGEIDTRGDHRIAMAFLILGLAARRPVRVDGGEMIGTSFPRFADVIASIGGRIE